MIVWTIEAARASSRIDDLIVSTDDPEIAEISHRHGADIPFMRPSELASHTASSTAVILHALDTLGARGQYYDYLVELQPTSPLRGAADIDGAINLALERKADAVISVCKTDHPPEWSNTLPADRSMKDFFRPGVKETRSQDLPVSYRLNGAIYVFNCRRLLAQRNLDMDDNAYAYIMPRERSIDIDTRLDLRIAEAILAHGGEARP